MGTSSCIYNEFSGEVCCSLRREGKALAHSSSLTSQQPLRDPSAQPSRLLCVLGAHPALTCLKACNPLGLCLDCSVLQWRACFSAVSPHRSTPQQAISILACFTWCFPSTRYFQACFTSPLKQKMVLAGLTGLNGREKCGGACISHLCSPFLARGLEAFLAVTRICSYQAELFTICLKGRTCSSHSRLSQTHGRCSANIPRMN